MKKKKKSKKKHKKIILIKYRNNTLQEIQVIALMIETRWTEEIQLIQQDLYHHNYKL